MMRIPPHLRVPERRSCPVARQARANRPENCSGSRESGFVLLSVLLLVALIVLALAVAAPKIADSIRRDRENEFYHRGMQYQRAIKLYYRKFQRYPTSLDQLEKTNDVRFLRKRYKDPISGKDEWRLIHLGEAKVPPMGFFGQPLAAGVAAAAVGSPIGSAGGAGASPTAGGFSAITPPTAGSSTPGTSNPGSTTPGSPTDGTDSGSPASGTAGTLGSASGSASSLGPTTGSGGPIVGVSSTSDKPSIRIYNKQAHYNEWEFVYDPTQDKAGLAAAQGSGAGTTPVPGAPGSSNVPGAVSEGGGSSEGGNGGVSAPPPTNPNTPQ